MDQQDPTKHKRLMRWPEAERLTGMSRATLTNMAARGDFVRPVQVSVHVTALLAHEVFEWLEGLEDRRVQYAPKQFKRAATKGDQP